VKDSYNCDAVSIVAATAALADQEHARGTWKAIVTERARLSSELAARGWDVIPSQTNFVFARPPGGNAGEVYRALKAKGILVRYFDKPGLADRLRITVGRPDETDALLGAL
jgi:histidinol-phosphate aminotransferase